MRAVVQRTLSSSVTVDGTTVGAAGHGLTVLLGVGRDDTETDLKYVADKIINLRIFEDDEGKMNRSLKDIGGDMDTTVVVDKAYRFTGPESYHSIIGQVMAYMGYVGGHEDSQVAARVGLDDSDGRIRLWCDFFSAGRTFHSEAVLCRQGHWAEDAKLCLLHWHARHTGEEPSNWGTLTGVRPTKLVHHLFDQGLDPSQAAARLHSRYHGFEGTDKRRPEWGSNLYRNTTERMTMEWKQWMV